MFQTTNQLQLVYTTILGQMLFMLTTLWLFNVAYWKFTNFNKLIIINIFFNGPSIYYRQITTG